MGDLEDVAGGVADHGPAVPVGGVDRRLDRRGAGGDRAAIDEVGVGDVNVKKSGEDVPLACGCLRSRAPTNTPEGRPEARTPEKRTNDVRTSLPRRLAGVKVGDVSTSWTRRLPTRMTPA